VVQLLCKPRGRMRPRSSRWKEADGKPCDPPGQTPWERLFGSDAAASQPPHALFPAPPRRLLRR
jgi:hypothetical protein